MNTRNYFLALGISIFCIAVNAQTTQHHYDYDANGNRIARNTVLLPLAPPAGGGQGASQKTEEPLAMPLAEDITLLAYPNPTAQHVEIAATGAVAIQEARLYNAQGKVLQQMQNIALPLQIEMGHLPAGNYIIWLQLLDGKIERLQVVRR